MKTSKKTTARKSAAPAPTRQRGNISKEEKIPLAIVARQAFDYQLHLGNVDQDTKFDAWRREEVMVHFQRDGLSGLDHGHFNPVLAHFATLAGLDDVAIKALLKSGKVRDSGAPEDTHETRGQLVAVIQQNLRDHAAWPDPEGKGHIGEGYLISIARSKFPKATIRSADTLAGSLTLAQLRQLLSTIRSRISTREGRADPTRRKPRAKPLQKSCEPDSDRPF